jgi:class 3 adenylate cyclase/mannose-6-phosphate isomerase-like protein (cupin superfamily)
MAHPQLKNLKSPDDRIELGPLHERSVQMGEQTIGRATVQPGWRWSVHVQPAVGTPSCNFHHLGLVLSGRLGVRMDDGSELEIGPDDVFDIPPGHDAWVVGSEPYESVEIRGIFGFGRPESSGNASIATVLLTDIVDSTSTLERVGAIEWQRLLTAQFEQARRALDRHRGVEVATTGDGMLATFDSAARAIRASTEMHDAAATLDLRLRAGVHTGEIEHVPGNIRGLAVHLVSRLAAAAEPGETFVSAVAMGLVEAADIVFEDRGAHELKGVTGTRQVYAARVTSA